MVKRHTARWAVVATLAVGCSLAHAAQGATFSTEAEFLLAVVAPTTVSFDSVAVGPPPPFPLQLGAVTVDRGINPFGAPLIFGPGPFGFTTNFLSIAAQDGGNELVITFPAGTKAAGMELVSVLPVTVTATYGSGSETVTFSASQVSFLGFAHPSDLQSITLSSPFTPQSTPIVNVGDISYASALVTGGALGIPTLSQGGLVLLALGLLLAGWRVLSLRRAGGTTLAR